MPVNIARNQHSGAISEEAENLVAAPLLRRLLLPHRQVLNNWYCWSITRRSDTPA